MDERLISVKLRVKGPAEVIQDDEFIVEFVADIPEHLTNVNEDDDISVELVGWS